MAKETKLNKAVKHVIDRLEDNLDDDVRELAYEAIGELSLKFRNGEGDVDELTKKAMKSPEILKSLEQLVGLVVANLQGCLEFSDE